MNLPKKKYVQIWNQTTEKEEEYYVLTESGMKQLAVFLMKGYGIGRNSAVIKFLRGE